MKLSSRMLVNSLIISSLVLLLIGVTGYYFLETFIVESQFHFSEDRTQEYATQIESNIAAGIRDVEQLASLPFLKRSSNAEQLQVFVQDANAFLYRYDDISIIDPNGIVIASTAFDFEGVWGSKIWFQKALTGVATWSSPHVVLSPRRIVIEYVAPVYDDSGNVKYVVSLRLPMDEIWRYTDNAQFGETGFLFLENQHDLILAHPDKSKIYTLREEKTINLTPRAHVFFSKHKNDDHYLAEYAYDGRMFVGSTSKIKVLSPSLESQYIEWDVYLFQSASEFYGIVDRAYFYFELIAIASVIYSLLATLLLVRRPVNSINLLKDKVHETNEHGLTTSVLINGKDEIRELSEAFEKLRLDTKLSHDDLHKAYSELKQLSYMKDSFLSNVSHELRTPLTSIKSYNQLVHHEMLGPLNEEQKDALSVALRSADNLIKLVSNLLDLSRLESGKADYHFKQESFVSIVEHAIQEIRPLLDEVGGSIHVNTTGGFFDVFADVDTIRQVLINILGNAIKYRSEDQKLRIDVDLAKQGDFVSVSISDNGMGIKKNELAHVFDKFYQVDQSLTKKVPGTGLGLSIVQRIVQDHDGSVDVTSIFGKGTTFVVNLPAYDPQAHKENPEDEKNEEK